MIYQAANCDLIGASYDEKMTTAEIEQFIKIQDRFFPVRPSNGLPIRRGRRRELLISSRQSRAGEPDSGWHQEEVYSVSYEDIEVLIDRRVVGEIEIRVWRNGKNEEYPYAKLLFQLETGDEHEPEEQGPIAGAEQVSTGTQVEGQYRQIRKRLRDLADHGLQNPSRTVSNQIFSPFLRSMRSKHGRTDS